MKLLICILFCVSFSFGQTDRNLIPYVDKYNDTVPNYMTRRIVKISQVDTSEFFRGDWKTHPYEFKNGAKCYVIWININCKNKRKAIEESLEAAYKMVRASEKKIL